MKIIGFGSLCVDYVAICKTMPKPDSKTRTEDSILIAGGNVGNTLASLSQLEFECLIISKVGSDAYAKHILDSLEKDGVDTSLVVCGINMASSFTYIIVDSENKTRTCINTPLKEDFTPTEALTFCTLLDEAILTQDSIGCVHLDSRHTKAGVALAHFANERKILVTIDLEKDRPHLKELLPLCHLLFTNANFPAEYLELDYCSHGNKLLMDELYESWGYANLKQGDDIDLPPVPSLSSSPSYEDEEKTNIDSYSYYLHRTVYGMVSLLKQGKAKFVIVTLGDRGSMVAWKTADSLESSKFQFNEDDVSEEEYEIDDDASKFWIELLDPNNIHLANERDLSFLLQFVKKLTPRPFIPKWADKCQWANHGEGYTIIVCPPRQVSNFDIVDTTGAGDVFIAAFIAGVIARYSPQSCLQLGTYLASENIKGAGARASLKTTAGLMRIASEKN